MESQTNDNDNNLNETEDDKNNMVKQMSAVFFVLKTEGKIKCSTVFGLTLSELF